MDRRERLEGASEGTGDRTARELQRNKEGETEREQSAASRPSLSLSLSVDLRPFVEFLLLSDARARASERERGDREKRVSVSGSALHSRVRVREERRRSLTHETQEERSWTRDLTFLHVMMSHILPLVPHPLSCKRVGQSCLSLCHTQVHRQIASHLHKPSHTSAYEEQQQQPQRDCSGSR